MDDIPPQKKPLVVEDTVTCFRNVNKEFKKSILFVQSNRSCERMFNNGNLPEDV